MSTNEPPPEQPGDGPPAEGPPSHGPPPPFEPPPPPPGGYGGPPPPAAAGGPNAATGEYNVGTAFTYGWNKFTANVGQVLIAIAVLLAIAIAIQIVGWIIGNAVACEAEATYTDSGLEIDGCTGVLVAQNIVSFLFGLVTWVVSMIIGAGVVRGALKVTEGEQFDARTILTPHRLPEVVIAAVLVGVATFVGLVLCVLPGLAVMFFTSYTLYFLMDRDDLGAIDAIKASVEFTMKNAGNVILWFLLSLAAWFVGVLLCGIGLIVAVPVVIFGTAYTYKKLSGQEVAA